jgi:hypothetical protein
MCIQTFKTNKVRKRCVIIHTENMNKFVLLKDSVFPFGRKGPLHTGTVFSHLDIKG